MASLIASLTLSKLPSSSPKLSLNSQKYPKSITTNLTGHFYDRKASIYLTYTGATTPSGPGLYSSQTFELTVANVDMVLEDVRPYLIADCGNVDVVSVEDDVISPKLQGH